MKNIYIRVSTEKQDTNSQLYAIQQYCKAQGIVTDNIIEDNCSGTLHPSKRNLGFLLNNSKKGDLILVSEISRISRNEDDMASVIRNARLGGYRIYAIKEGRFYGSNNVQLSERIMDVVEGHISADFAKKTSQRTSEALQMRKALIVKENGFISKGGAWITKLGNPSSLQEAGDKGRIENKKRWDEKLKNSVELRQAYGVIKLLKAKGDTNKSIADYLERNNYRTATDKLFLPSSLCQFMRRGKRCGFDLEVA